MQLEIITPESNIFKGEVDAVQLPGLDGSFQVLKGHAPIISGLAKGVIKVDLTAALDGKKKKMHPKVLKDATNAKVVRVEIAGGVIEMLNDKIVVLAE
jgi:F-type H+-transporting ATPase subunit epsilon